MGTISVFRRLALAAAAFAGFDLPVAAQTPERHGFDFYVLALSWSPSYCMAAGANANRLQCGGDADYGFVVHGLWPQYERDYPEYCRSEQPDRVPQALGDDYFDIMPGMGLIGHQWRKHGTCTGLSQSDYLALTRAAFERVDLPDTIDDRTSVDPDSIENALIAANRGLDADEIAVTCDAGLLREIRICLTTDLDFRSCPEVDRRGCLQSSVEMPPRL